jgi:hypothetical protein
MNELSREVKTVVRSKWMMKIIYTQDVLSSASGRLAWFSSAPIPSEIIFDMSLGHARMVEKQAVLEKIVEKSLTDAVLWMR